ncbi:hypothetical protein IWZ01DRAFT_482673 [Phyllosticta capitalensis]
MSCPSRDFLDITVHTARCGDCNTRNRSILKRCPRCGHQQCVPCNQVRNGQHGMHLMGLTDLSIGDGASRKSSGVSLKKRSGGSSVETGSRPGRGRSSRQQSTTSSRKRSASRGEEEQTTRRKKRLVRGSKRMSDGNGRDGRPRDGTPEAPMPIRSASSSPGLFVSANTPPVGHVRADSLRWSPRAANHHRSPPRLLSPGLPTPASSRRQAPDTDMAPHRDESPFRGFDINDGWSFPDEGEGEREHTRQLPARHHGVENGNGHQVNGDSRQLPVRPNGLVNGNINGHPLTNGHALPNGNDMVNGNGLSNGLGGTTNGLGAAVNGNGHVPSIEIYEDSPSASPAARLPPSAPPNSPRILDLDAAQRQRRDTSVSTDIDEPAQPSTFRGHRRALHSLEVTDNTRFLDTVPEDDASPPPGPRVGQLQHPQNPPHVPGTPHTPSTLLSRGRTNATAPTPGNEENFHPVQDSPGTEPSSPDTQIAAPAVQSPTQYTVGHPWPTVQAEQAYNNWTRLYQPHGLGGLERAATRDDEAQTTESHATHTTTTPRTNGTSSQPETTESQSRSRDHSPGAYNHRATRSGRYAPRNLDGTMDSPPSTTMSTRDAHKESSRARPGTYEEIEEVLDKVPLSESYRRQPRAALPPLMGLDMLKPSARSAVLEYRGAYERARQKEIEEYDLWMMEEQRKETEMRIEMHRRRRAAQRTQFHAADAPDHSLGAQSGTVVVPNSRITYSAVRDVPEPGRRQSVDPKSQIDKLIQHLPGEDWDWETYQLVHGAIHLDDQLPPEQRRLSARERRDAEEILMDLIPDTLPRTDEEERARREREEDEEDEEDEE